MGSRRLQNGKSTGWETNWWGKNELTRQWLQDYFSVSLCSNGAKMDVEKVVWRQADPSTPITKANPKQHIS